MQWWSFLIHITGVINTFYSSQIGSVSRIISSGAFSCLDSLNGNRHGEDKCILAEVTLNYTTVAQKRLKRHKWDGQKILDMITDSCTLRNSTADQMSAVIFDGLEER